MRRAIAAVVGGVALAVTAIAAVFIVGMRRKSPLVLDAVRRMNRSVGNPRQMKSAGTPGAYASVIKHVGRTSGRAYETPVGAIPTDDGFLIALPYGTRADWLKNVMAAGSAAIVHEGATRQVDHPELVATTEVAPQLPARELRTLRLFRVDLCLRVRLSGHDAKVGPATNGPKDQGEQ
jgi:deazaflavin-dependent oxidoreductase (nitroreductase family)